MKEERITCLQMKSSWWQTRRREYNGDVGWSELDEENEYGSCGNKKRFAFNQKRKKNWFNKYLADFVTLTEVIKREKSISNAKFSCHSKELIQVRGICLQIQCSKIEKETYQKVFAAVLVKKWAKGVVKGRKELTRKK